MASITFHNDAVYAPAPVSIAKPAPKVEAVVRPASQMHADDTVALRIVSTIIFTVVALGTLAMLATVLICG